MYPILLSLLTYVLCLDQTLFFYKVICWPYLITQESRKMLRISIYILYTPLETFIDNLGLMQQKFEAFAMIDHLHEILTIELCTCQNSSLK